MRDFTDFEMIAIENAYEELLNLLDEQEPEDADFWSALEDVVYMYDLDARQEDEVKRQYDEECDC